MPDAVRVCVRQGEPLRAADGHHRPGGWAKCGTPGAAHEAWQAQTSYAASGTADRQLRDPVELIRLFRRCAPRTCLKLVERTTPKRERGVAGAPRMEGSWGLVFLAHIIAGNPDWQNWYDGHRSSPLCAECGFEQVPSRQTLYLRFAELEDDRYVAAFTDAANSFIRVAARREPRAFRCFHTDGTPAHSHAKLRHACPSDAYGQDSPAANCPYRAK